MKKKKALKGFTLLELIIVMALFSLIMYSVVSLLDPVSRFFVRSSNYETSTACVDNMKRAIEGNLKYADRVRVYADYNPATHLQGHVEEFWEYFFEDREFIDCAGTIYAMVFDNTVPTIGSTNLSDFMQAQENSGKITLYEYEFTNSSFSLSGAPQEWYVNQKMYGNYDYQFMLGSFDFDPTATAVTTTTGPGAPAPAPGSAVRFDPSDCTISIMSYEVTRVRGGGGLQISTIPQTNSASFAMKNVLDPETNYTSALEEFKIIQNPLGGTGYSITGDKQYVVETGPLGQPIPYARYDRLDRNPSGDFHADSLDGSGSTIAGFYFIFTTPESVEDDPDMDYMLDVDTAFTP